MAMKPEPRFYIAREEGQTAGPYDVVQMAGLLRRKIITGDTPTCLEGADDWKPFSWQPQFSIAREMPADAVSARMVELDEETAEAQSGPIPLPSRETTTRLLYLFVGGLSAGAVAYLLGWLDSTLGTCLAVSGAALAAVGQCMILVRLLDESFWSLMLVFFVPLGDIYFLICNFERYFTWICVKYVGTAVAIGASIGMRAQFSH